VGKILFGFWFMWGIERVILGFKLKNYFKLVKRWVFWGSFWVWWILEWFYLFMEAYSSCGIMKL